MNKTKAQNRHEKTQFPQIAFDFGLIIKFTKHFKLGKKAIERNKHHARNTIKFLCKLLKLNFDFAAHCVQR